MPLPASAYTGESMTNTDGLSYAVIDVSKLDFEGPGSSWGKKVAPTRVLLGHLGDVIHTRPGGFDETPPYHVQKEGELIFVNPMPDGSLDVYAPPNAEETLAENYTLIGGDITSKEGAVYLPTMRPVRILREGIDRPTVIPNAHGEGRHAFFREGATLKLQDGKVSGIHKDMFDLTWKQTDVRGRVLDAAKTGSLGR